MSGLPKTTLTRKGIDEAARITEKKNSMKGAITLSTMVSLRICHAARKVT